jgi:hypothetical protein
MGFLQPLALLGLAAVGIPPLLHLLDRRRPPVVPFPAIRYVVATEREHSRRLRLRNLLVLLLRMLVIVCIVLAAARPVVPWARGRGHEPTAVGLVLDNSPSAGAVFEGEPHWDRLVSVARGIVARVTGDDALWVATASGALDRLSAADARDLLDTLGTSAIRMDVVETVRRLDAMLAQAPQARREIVVLSDGQASAFAGALQRTEAVVLVLEPAPSVANRGIDSVRIERVAGSDLARVAVSVGGQGDRSAVVLRQGDRTLARAVAGPGETAVLEARLAPGWHALRVEVDPDELRVDDRQWVVMHMSPAAPATAGDDPGPFVRDALAVLTASGRLAAGDEVVVGSGVTGAAVLVLPPSDPAMTGALNRDLAARGVPWQFGSPLSGAWVVDGDAFGLAGTPVYRRHALTGSGTVLASIAGMPWLVHDGEVAIVASRLQPEWTDLPVRAGFLPFLDGIVNRLGRRRGWIVRGHPGAFVRLPANGVTLLLDGDARPVPADRRVGGLTDAGVAFVLGPTGDTVGAIRVSPDPRESAVDVVARATVRGSLGSEARLVGAGALDRDLFSGARRAELATALLIAALLAGIAELAVATLVGRSRAP